MRVPLLETLSVEAVSMLFVVLNENVSEDTVSPLSPVMRTTTASMEGRGRAARRTCTYVWLTQAYSRSRTRAHARARTHARMQRQQQQQQQQQQHEVFMVSRKA